MSKYEVLEHNIASLYKKINLAIVCLINKSNRLHMCFLLCNAGQGYERLLSLCLDFQKPLQ